MEKSADFFYLRSSNDFYKMISGKHQEKFTTKQGGNCKIRMNAIVVFSCVMLGEIPLNPLEIVDATKKPSECIKILVSCLHSAIRFARFATKKQIYRIQNQMK